jgi:monoamine oxidase
MRQSRREWLLGAAALVAAGCVHSAPNAQKAPGPPSTPSTRSRSNGRPVVVLGAGLAGLATALSLANSGVDVVVLEAQSRPGGRIHTVRAFSEGLYAEAGATFVGGDPDLLALIASVDVKLVRPQAPRGLATVAYLQGKRTRLGIDEDPPARHVFTAEEAELGFMGRRKKLFGNMTRFDESAPWPPPALARHDAQNGIELLTELGASPGYTAEFGSSAVGEHMEEVSGAFVLREMAGFLRDVSLEGGGRIAGGTDRLPFAIAQRLGARVLYGAEVKRIAQDERGARVSFVRGGVVENLEADRIVCAIPYSVLRHVETAAGFSAMKQRAIHELPMVSVARVYAQVDRRFWLERGEGGDVDTDLPTGSLRDETRLQPGTAGVLGAYLSSDKARAFTALPVADRLAAFLDGAEKAHPGAKAHVVSGTMKCWDEDPFARGAYAWFKKDQMMAFGAAMSAPEGRVHFAGDHTSHRPGWMHGAVASATRAAREVLATRT